MMDFQSTDALVAWKLIATVQSLEHLGHQYANMAGKIYKLYPHLSRQK
jgi:hypothetical protein